MASQLLPIRNLGTAAIFRASHSSSFSRFLAQLKLKNFPFSSRPCRLVHRREYTGGQTFSPRSARSGSKSLIEDEAELSDWVSDIRKDAFHRKLSSEDESSARDRGTGSKVRDRDLLKSKGGERNFRPAVHGGPSSRRIRLGQSKRGRGDYQFGDDVDDDYTDDDNDNNDVDDDDDDEEDSDGQSDFGSDFFGDKEALKDSAAEGAGEKGSSVFSTDGDIVKAISQTSTPRSESYLSLARFDQFPLSPLSLKGVKAAGYERMTEVQEATLPVILKGKDVLAKARTGTGKTVAFLLPAIEVVVKLPPLDRDNKRPPVHVLVICPTRELADQAAAEASKLLKYHASIGVQVVIGGTRLALEQKRMQTNPCQILVATPGRLRDHMENTPGFANRLSGVKVLVLDEADRLLDMGFRKDIEKIVAELPKQRQTLLFSATVPDQVRQMCYIAMKRDSEFISTVVEGSEETHSQVSQTHLIAPLDKQFSMLYRILIDHIAEDVDYKVILFCTTAMVTKFVADLLAELSLNVREMHSRKPQSYRTRVAKEFKESKGLILVTSDVSARGVDYPDVTLVIQVGVPADREQYIHRLGRTGRKGKEGKGILLLAPWENFFLQSIRDLPLTNAEVPIIDPDTRKKVERALAHVEMKNKESAYQAWLGYYKSIANIGRDKSKLVLFANEFSRSMGLDNPPAIAMLTLRKMGLNNVPGLRSK
ncbi:DEAD-box ATP-dependent RNA helicase 31 [Platanthera guangdongensis]|uniref:ATP-dependent RNA helicase n=1 Tax=Platanthera guangdongensis TaxID=2320717 RepID=A0ABR2M103_9ASPA